MARALLIGCGCHARAAGGILAERGWSVRGTTRSPERMSGIEVAGIEGAIADPDRVGTVSELLGDVTVLAWLLGSARGSDVELGALHEERLPSLLAALVDTPVRGVVYEAAGSVPAEILAAGRREVERLGERHRIPVRILDAARDVEADDWAVAAAGAIEGVLAGP
ncbi:MAG TPA: hypothetical protein VKA36_03895 [Solirubrobacterales bacterium]|nr:hypothetical protein [Solirubrobacterales bacterium]